MVGPDAEEARAEQGGGRVLGRGGGELDRLGQGGRGGGAALSREGEPQLEQQGWPVRRVGWLVEPTAQIARGRAWGAAAAGRLGGRPQQRHHLRIAARFAVQQVQRDPLGVGAVAFEQAGRLRVGQGPLARRDGLIDRGPHDRVGELEHRPGRQHVGRAQAVGEPRRIRDVLARERGGVPDRCRAAEDRQRLGQPSRALPELADPPQHGPGDRFRRQVFHPRQRVAAARLAQRGGQRFEQERVPAGVVMAGPAQLRVRLPAEPLPHERGGRLAAERPERQQRALRAGAQLLEYPRLVRAAARGEQQGDGQAVDAGREVGEPPQRRRVGPVRVVHRDHQRPARREVRGQPVEAVRRRVRDVVLDRSGAGPVEHPGGEPGGAVQQLVPLAGAGRGADRLDELAGDAVGEAALQGEPAGGEDPRAGHRRAGAGHPEQRGLADPGGPLHQDEGAVPRLGGIGRGREHRQFRVAPENHRVTVEHGTRPLEPDTA